VRRSESESRAGEEDRREQRGERGAKSVARGRGKSSLGKRGRAAEPAYIASPNGRIQRSGGAGGRGLTAEVMPRLCRSPLSGRARAGTTGQCSGIGTAHLSNRARHGHDGRRVMLGPCFSVVCLGHPVVPRLNGHVYVPPSSTATPSSPRTC
jgi:hypothetical protein